VARLTGVEFSEAEALTDIVVTDERAAVVDVPRDAVVVVPALLEDGLAHVNAVNVDYDLDAVVLEEVARDEVPDAKQLASLGLDVHDLGYRISIITVRMLSDGATVHEDGRLEFGEEGMRWHHEEVVVML
jgi:hypothetical protein